MPGHSFRVSKKKRIFRTKVSEVSEDPEVPKAPKEKSLIWKDGYGEKRTLDWTSPKNGDKWRGGKPRKGWMQHSKVS
jgi:hypothetical protein